MNFPGWLHATMAFIGALGKPALFGLLAVFLICTGFLWWVVADGARTKRLATLIMAFKSPDPPPPALPGSLKGKRRQ